MKHKIIVVVCCILLFISCYKESDYQPANINTSLITLSAADASIVGDGDAFTYITAELPLETRDDKSSVVFTTNKGTFENTQKTITKTATIQSVGGVNKRIAKVKLISSTKIEKATVEATIGDITKTVDVSFVSINYDALMTITTSGTQIPADGESSLLITVEQPLDTKDDYTSIVFTTSKGSFENGSKTITKPSTIILENSVYKRKSLVKLISSKKVETADIEISVKNTLKKLSIPFLNAFPETLKLSASALILSGGFANLLTVTTTLLRPVGTPSAQNISDLFVFDANKNKIGYFQNYLSSSDETGTIQNKFTLGDYTYKGALKIIAIGTNALGKTITSDTLFITAQ